MRRIGLVLGITAATLVLQTGAFAAGYVWLEAENTASTNLKPNVAGWGRKQFLSEEKWLHVSIDAGKVDAELPAEGGLLGYAFTLDGDGAYEVWNRIGFEFVRSPFDWRLDGGEWHRVAPDALTTDLMELQTWCEVAWLKLADVPLKAGPHTLDIRLPKTQDEKGGTARVLYALDVVCIHDGRFRPNGAHRPDADTRSARDREAEARVVELPGTAAAEARASVGLDGLWEVCRDDEQLPAEVAAAISRLPENPIWRAIDVPGDKNALRPDLIFCHRFWYRTRVRVPEALAGRSFFLVFPQNNLNTTVYVNGVLCGFDKNPFARVQIDVSKGIRAGQVNEVWVGIRDAYYGFSTSPNDPMKLRRLFNYPLEWSNHGFMDLAYPVWNHFQSGILATPRLVAAGSTYVSAGPSTGPGTSGLASMTRTAASTRPSRRVPCSAANGTGPSRPAPRSPALSASSTTRVIRTRSPSTGP